LAAATGLETIAGQILGTPPYMSPEQARGKEVDERTDIWAFGCLLYELLTGTRAFRGEVLADTIAAILEREPDWRLLPAATPEKIRLLLRQCLQKDPGRRLQKMADARKQIEEALAAPRQRGLRRWQLAAVAALALAIFAIGAAVWMRGPAHPADRSQWIQITNFPDSVSQPALSPDGRMLTFLRGPNSLIGKSEVYLKLLPDGEPVQLTRDGTPKMGPAISPDGSQISYTVLDQNSWDTWTVPVGGGTPRLWLPNAEGLSWIGKHSLLYSEIKTGQQMAIVTSLEGRAQHRDIYVPAHGNGMAHRSNVSPDGKWVVIVEMDEKGVWMRCRLTPFDGSSAGRPVGPAGLCRSAAWSVDGKWIFLSANAGDDFHLWRQRFPDGKPERLTSGPNAEEGIAVAPDGHSLITAVGLSQRPIWFHDSAGDHQVSLEGYSFFPYFYFYDSGRKVVYRIGKGYQGLGTTSELWIADLESGRNEPLLPGFQVISHDVSGDGRLVFCALDAGGKPRLWLAALDRRGPPRQIGSVEATRALFGPPGVIFFLATDGASTFLFAIGEDGTGRRKVSPAPIYEIDGVSPDGRWVSANSGSASYQGKNSYACAYPTNGGPPVALSNAPALVRWAPDGRYLYLQKPSGFSNGGAAGRTYVLPTRPGTMLPDLPAGGFRTEAELSAAPRVRVIEAADVGPGPTPDVYVFSRDSVQRNLYRIPIP
jgi:Tol biopolymer transport system component